MSRIGKKPILIPEGVEVKIEGQKFTAKGPQGELSKEIRPEIKVEVKENQVIVFPQPSNKRLVRRDQTKALWGSIRALLNNMIKGVKEGFEKKLEIEGLGFKAVVEDNILVLFVGFINPVRIIAPEGVKFSVEKNIISVSGADLEKVSQVAAQIKRTRPAEPYKGKGIKYLGEHIRRKVGKKVVATAG